MTDMDIDLDELESGQKTETPVVKVGEKGFGTCKTCGKKTMGKTNTLCSVCGGTPVHELLGMPEGDLPLKPVGTFEKTYPSGDKRTGYHARYYKSGPVVGRMQ